MSVAWEHTRQLLDAWQTGKPLYLTVDIDAVGNADDKFNPTSVAVHPGGTAEAEAIDAAKHQQTVYLRDGVAVPVVPVEWPNGVLHVVTSVGRGYPASNVSLVEPPEGAS